MSADPPHPPPDPHRPAPSAAPLPVSPSPEEAGTAALEEALRSSFFIVRILLAGLVVYFLVSNVNFINTQERALVLRFGRPVMRDGRIEQGPGLVWAYPYPIDEVVRVPVTELQTVQSSVGWYATTPEQQANNVLPEAGPSLNPAVEGYAITADGNIIHARAVIRYQVSDPVKFSLNHRNGARFMTNIVDNAMTYAAARFDVDDALRRNVTGFKEAVVKRVSDLVQAYDLGVTIEPSEVITRPPLYLKSDFDAVLTAEATRAQTVNNAEGYRNRVVNEASGQAEGLVNAGRTDANRLVQEVSSEAKSFEALLPEYRKNPDFFRERLLTEALGRVYTNAQQKFVLPPMRDGDQLWLHLNPETARRTNAPSLTP